ncbi:fused signal recognition particle receptor [Candidatus Xenohaliotis californiensis]|uniref:Fused signal recognition particle receptor n=1 Tax=Candidatus Xenohaliotis californiensis TaxID=84677 RepID=A0ABP0EXR5_9RICK|nr:fused signal recognition particle receptor [Candidatus Xenohaliotis californiensis]
MWLSKLKKTNKKEVSLNSKSIVRRINNILFGTGSYLNADALSKIEKILIEADFGYKITQELLSSIKNAKMDVNSNNIISPILSQYVKSILTPSIKPLENSFIHKPYVIMVCGVNGSGKTTTIGKIAYKYRNMGLKTLIAACDTFRASAVEQLGIWAERAKCDFFAGSENADPASVAYKALDKALNNYYDLLIVDTAGRLHTQNNLMAELAKIARVLSKQIPEAPHDILLVLDTTTGQNALNQVGHFLSLINITGLVLTKLDGTAKAGAIVNIISNHNNLKIRAIGNGEKITDLSDFVLDDFCAKISVT